MKRYSKRRLKGLLLYANTAVLVSPTDRSTLSKAFLGVGGLLNVFGRMGYKTRYETKRIRLGKVNYTSK